MQQAAFELKNQLWDRLKEIFNRYASSRTGEIETGRVQEIVKDVLGEISKMEIDYVVKNMFRLDVDQNGSVSLLQFGNFLFKRHCGQMSLQKMHRANKLQYGSQRKITLNEFIELMNNAYLFLNVKCNKELAKSIFEEADKDKDGLITYVQYFQFIEKYVCQTESQFQSYDKDGALDLGREWKSKLRAYIWSQLSRQYSAYGSGRSLVIDDKSLRELVIFLMGNMSQMEIMFLLNGLFKLSSLDFSPFAKLFLMLVAELGLSRFEKNHASNKRKLNMEEFIILFYNTYKFLAVSRVKRNILELIFRKIDKNSDGFISFDEYLEWIKRVIAVLICRGDEFRVLEDDEDFDKTAILDEILKVSLPQQSKRKKSKVRFYFDSYELAETVRKRTFELLKEFDFNGNEILDENQIVAALKKILTSNDLEIDYVTRNEFRYDSKSSGNVSFSEFTDYCVQLHFGQLSIQRLHRRSYYSRGRERIMNQQQFSKTINDALQYISVQASPQQLQEIFSILNSSKNGWITYETYFIFLKEYFGSLSPISNREKAAQKSEEELYLESLAKLSAMERFIKMIIGQLRNIFFLYDFDKNLVFSMDEIEAILLQVFGLSESEINFILFTFFRMESRKNQTLEFEELVKILLQIYLVEISIKRKYLNISPSEWKVKKINVNEFIQLIMSGCFFLKFKPLRADLTIIFKILDTDKDGYITFAQYFEFIRQYLCEGYELPDAEEKKQKSLKEIGTSSSIEERHAQVPKNVSKEEWEFILLIWRELRRYFDEYDVGNKNYLSDQELKKFIMEVLNETSQNQLDYVFWNMSRVDINANQKTQFEQFAPFILNHAGEIALQKFHKQQIKGKSALTEEELLITFNNAFCFLKSIPKEKSAVNLIYNRIGKGSDVKYGAYLSWIHRALARKFL